MSILRLLLVVLVIVIGGSWLMGYWSGSSTSPLGRPAASDTSGAVDRARERGAEIGETAAVATSKVEETLSEAALTTKIKAKMALDDVVKARAIDVTTHGTTVTLSGTVESKGEHDRAMSLARETAEVTRVIDDLHTR